MFALYEDKHVELSSMNISQLRLDNDALIVWNIQQGYLNVTSAIGKNWSISFTPQLILSNASNAGLNPIVCDQIPCFVNYSSVPDMVQVKIETTGSIELEIGNYGFNFGIPRDSCYRDCNRTIDVIATDYLVWYSNISDSNPNDQQITLISFYAKSNFLFPM